MKWRWFVLVTFLVGSLIVACLVWAGNVSNWNGVVLLLIAVIFFIEQAERNIIERLDRIEKLIRAKAGNEV
ncbi:MAG TPA: hypothetical protein VKF84_00880 [Candidatus Sulfotelmatobacter sp.]|nr:hypothetical protein [Candidatus Sulfotelmatobacter sp.]